MKKPEIATGSEGGELNSVVTSKTLTTSVAGRKG